VTITEFLTARLDEDEATAKATAPSGSRYQWRVDVQTDDDERIVGYCVISDPDVSGVAGAWGLERGTGQQVAVHIALHDPARVLREVEAGRKILAEHVPVRHQGRLMCATCLAACTFWPCPTLLALAAVHRDHPDWREDWLVT